MRGLQEWVIWSASSNDMDPYVRLARDTITEYFISGNVINVPSDLPSEMLSEASGVFVSLHLKGELRGCIGTMVPTCENIAMEIIRNSISSATKDPRFSPLTAEELKDLEINVDVLTMPEPVGSTDELDPSKYGVIVTSGYKRGLLLPDLEGVDTVEDQIMICKAKAGILPIEKITLQRFEVVRHT